MKSYLTPMIGLICLVVLLPFLCGMVPIVRFTEECIHIDVFPEYVTVNGIYTYRNPWPLPVTQGLWVPFPVDTGNPIPALVSINVPGRNAAEIPVIEFGSRVWFELHFKAKETIQLQVNYRQRAESPKARYILTTTMPWRKPLERGEYRIFANRVRVIESNYPLQQIPAGCLGFDRRRFMPQEDWLVKWERLP